MQGPSEKFDYGPDGVRVFNGRAFLSHNAHIRAGKRSWPKNCRICSGGLEGFSDVDPEALAEGDVVQDSGIDEEGAAASAHDLREDRKERAIELLLSDGEE